MVVDISCLVDVFKDKTRLYKHGKTTFIFFAGIGFGLSWSLVGPTIPDLCHRMGITVKDISWAFSLRAFLTMATCPLIGAVLEKVQRQDLVMGVAMATLGLSRIIIPFCKVLWLYGIATYFEIVSYNVSEIAIDILLLKMWGKDADPSISAWHLSFCVGFAIGPLVILPFLYDTEVATIQPSNASLYGNTTSETVKAEFVPSPIEYPYVMIGLYLLIIAVIAFIFHVAPNPTKDIHGNEDEKKKTTFKDIVTFTDLRKLDRPKPMLITLCGLFWLYFVCAMGLGATFHTFLFTYCSVSSLGFTKHESAMLDFANKFALAVGRIITTPVSFCVGPQILIFITVFGAFIFITPLVFLAEEAKIYLWVFTILFNIFLSPEWNVGVSWMDKYVPLSASLMTLVILAESIAMIVFQYISGAILTDYTPMHLIYMFVAIGGFHCVVTIVMQIAGCKMGTRFSSEHDDKENHTISQQIVVATSMYGKSFENIDKKELEAFLQDEKEGRVSSV